MTRKALIIACPGKENTSGYLPGTMKDLENYYNFLYSKKGGDWYSFEIQKMINPTSKDVENHISKINQDYSFIVYSGHGGISTTDDKMYLEMQDKDIPLHSLRTQAKRQTIIIDSCRSFFTPEVSNKLELALMERKYSAISNARELFEKDVLSCDEGIIILYSSKPGQASGDNSKIGGIFSASLIKAGEKWGESFGSNQMMSLYDAFSEAVKIIKQEFPLSTQNPEIDGGRRNKYFPFALRSNGII